MYRPACVATACVVLGGSLAGASTVAYRTDAELIAASDRMVHGRVLSVRTERGADGRTIYSVARLAVLEDFTGNSDPVIEVWELGGTIDWFDTEPGLADQAVSTTIESTNGVGILVERAMWWPGDATTWYEAHNLPGATATGTRWGLAEGEVGGASSTQSYILIANTSAFAGSATVTLLFETVRRR